jgi:hypothetical protein
MARGVKFGRKLKLSQNQREEAIRQVHTHYWNTRSFERMRPR